VKPSCSCTPFAPKKHLSKRYFLIDESKFSEVAFAKIANVEEANIITNHLEIDLEKYKRQTNVIEADKQ
ncbi:hypothetical protein ACT453_02755, partial [Bacillus sp. D-CC]